MVPVNLILDDVGFQNWRNDFQAHFDYAKDKIQFIAQFEREVWQKFQQYKVPVIELLRSTQKEAVCQVFEKVNTGGVTLSVFELITATFAADNFLLRKDWTNAKSAYMMRTFVSSTTSIPRRSSHLLRF